MISSTWIRNREENPYQEPIEDDELTEEDTKYQNFKRTEKFGVDHH